MYKQYLKFLKTCPEGQSMGLGTQDALARFLESLTDEEMEQLLRLKEVQKVVDTAIATL